MGLSDTLLTPDEIRQALDEGGASYQAIIAPLEQKIAERQKQMDHLKREMILIEEQLQKGIENMLQSDIELSRRFKEWGMMIYGAF
ncbi:hypothetical protein STRDD13_00715 [Streptococcus sp. DD13]|nr:hypothetical protein STRDD13_00715 [Streptococcus sp. DD13]